MKAFTYTNQHLSNMIDSLSLDPSTISHFKHEVLKEYPNLSEYIYEVLTGCVEDYEPLTVARDYTGEYDTAHEIFGRLGNAAIPDLKNLDIRVLNLPLHYRQVSRTSILHEKNCGLGHTLDYPFSERNQPCEFSEITDELVNMIEAHYLNHEREKTTKHLLFTRHHTGLCVFVH